MIGSQQYGFITGDGRHGREHIHALRPRDPGDEFQSKSIHLLAASVSATADWTADSKD